LGIGGFLLLRKKEALGNLESLKGRIRKLGRPGIILRKGYYRGKSLSWNWAFWDWNFTFGFTELGLEGLAFLD